MPDLLKPSQKRLRELQEFNDEPVDRSVSRDSGKAGSLPLTVAPAAKPARSSLLMHRTPSVGSVVKKILAINPDLGGSELIDIIRKSTHAQGGIDSEFALAEVIDEDEALEYARATLNSALSSSERRSHD